MADKTAPVTLASGDKAMLERKPGDRYDVRVFNRAGNDLGVKATIDKDTTLVVVTKGKASLTIPTVAGQNEQDFVPRVEINGSVPLHIDGSGSAIIARESKQASTSNASPIGFARLFRADKNTNELEAPEDSLQQSGKDNKRFAEHAQLLKMKAPDNNDRTIAVEEGAAAHRIVNTGTNSVIFTLDGKKPFKANELSYNATVNAIEKRAESLIASETKLANSKTRGAAAELKKITAQENQMGFAQIGGAPAGPAPLDLNDPRGAIKQQAHKAFQLTETAGGGQTLLKNNPAYAQEFKALRDAAKAAQETPDEAHQKALKSAVRDVASRIQTIGNDARDFSIPANERQEYMMQHMRAQPFQKQLEDIEKALEDIKLPEKSGSLAPAASGQALADAIKAVHPSIAGQSGVDGATKPQPHLALVKASGDRTLT